MATPKSNAANDATVLLTGPDVRALTDSFRGANMVLNRLEVAIKELTKSNDKVVASNDQVVASNKALIDELRKGRRQGEKDRRRG